MTGAGARSCHCCAALKVLFASATPRAALRRLAGRGEQTAEQAYRKDDLARALREVLD